MKQYIQDFIEENIELLESDDLEGLYGELPDDDFTDFSCNLTLSLYEEGINPIEYFNKIVPTGFADNEYNVFDEYSKNIQITVTPQIHIIGPYSFYKARNVILSAPQNLNRIDYSAFHKCQFAKGNTDIILKSCSIDEYAFEDSNITSLTLNDCSLFDHAFRNCAKLKSVSISNVNRGIPSDVFSGCDSLKEVILSGNVESIDSYAFMCKTLVDVYLPDSLKDMDSDSFISQYTINFYISHSLFDRLGDMISKLNNGKVNIVYTD